MKFIFFLTCLILYSASYLNAETNENKEYGKYSFYSKCLDDASPRKLNNGLVYECSMEAKEKIENLIQEKILSKGSCHLIIPITSRLVFSNMKSANCDPTWPVIPVIKIESFKFIFDLYRLF